MSLTVSNDVSLKLWEAHRKEWSPCRKCTIGKFSCKRVLARGTVPCDVLFIGEAPGRSEDVCGEPFVGRSGKLLDSWIERACPKVRWAITNVVACRPADGPSGDNRKPQREEVFNCRPRLVEFVNRIAKPKVLVLLGRSAVDFLPGIVTGHLPRLALLHPAFVLRQGGQGSRADAKELSKLRAFIKEHSNE